MRRSTAIRWAHNPLLAALLVVTFLPRVLVPTGYMPGPGGVILCPGHATASTPAHDMSATGQMSMDMTGMDMVHASHSKHGGTAPDHENAGVCPFAGAATAIATHQSSPLAVLSHIVSTAVEIPPQPFGPRDSIAPNRLPRGPPSFA